MLKEMISGAADFAHYQTAQATEQEPLRRTCAYLDAAAAAGLIVVVSFILYGI